MHSTDNEVTQEDLAAVDTIGGHMASYYEFGQSDEYAAAREAARGFRLASIEAADRIEALEAENERLREDKLRLDFLDLCNARLNARYGAKYQWRLILNHNVSRLMLGSQEVDLDDSIANGLPSCRLAIDEQISAATRAALAGGGDE